MTKRRKRLLNGRSIGAHFQMGMGLLRACTHTRTWLSNISLKIFSIWAKIKFLPPQHGLSVDPSDSSSSSLIVTRLSCLHVLCQSPNPTYLNCPLLINLPFSFCMAPIFLAEKLYAWKPSKNFYIHAYAIDYSFRDR